MNKVTDALTNTFTVMGIMLWWTVDILFLVAVIVGVIALIYAVSKGVWYVIFVL